MAFNVYMIMAADDVSFFILFITTFVVHKCTRKESKQAGRRHFEIKPLFSKNQGTFTADEKGVDYLVTSYRLDQRTVESTEP